MMKCIFNLLGAAVLVVVAASASAQAQNWTKDSAAALFNQGHYAEALDAYRALLDKDAPPKDYAAFLRSAVSCLNNLGRLDEFDALVEQAAAAHPHNPELLYTAANLYRETTHYGYLVSDKFSRGYPRGGAVRPVNPVERDRTRTLQLLLAAKKSAARNDNIFPDIQFAIADVLTRDASAGEAWRLTHLSALDTLPAYDNEYYASEFRGAPAKSDGAPFFFAVPESWESAANDGERYRWVLHELAQAQPGQGPAVRFALASFWHKLYGVQTLAHYGFFETQDEAAAQAGRFAVSTLGETETIARLASGIKRFALPDEFNYIAIFKALAKDKSSTRSYAERSLEALAGIFENRRQYPKAAEYWRALVTRFGPGPDNERARRLDQITGAWGELEAANSQTASLPASLAYRFRNARSVSLRARRIRLDKLVGDMKEHLKSNPAQLDYNKTQLENIGYRLVTHNEAHYAGDQAAAWSVELKPRENHFDTRTTIDVPLTEPGAYLISAEAAGGNTSHIVLWLNDLVLVQKPLEEGMLYYLADARSGAPVPHTEIEFFGYAQHYRGGQKPGEPPPQRWYDIETKELSEKTDERGVVVLRKARDENMRWIAVSRSKKNNLAFTGFHSAWTGRGAHAAYDQTKAYFITDRPVYRPEQTVRFKAWLARASYDEAADSYFGENTVTLRVFNPKREKFLEKTLRTDSFGGIDGEFILAKDAPLGSYTMSLEHYSGSLSFRLEEYKKPEFEVSIGAPAEPAVLGEHIAAKVSAKYYFGAPLSEAKVKYKVMRTAYDSTWCAPAKWDWFYGPCYAHLGYDYEWYPGWGRWGLKAPHPLWHRRPPLQPEVVAENEVPLGKDGTAEIVIDTQPALELHGSSDHRYQIVAEVTDNSRRTITGTGEVLAARRPFQVRLSLDRGFYQSGEAIQAQASTHTLNQKPVTGRGVMKLYRIRYRSGAPEESLVNEWALNPDEQGRTSLKLTAAQSGQYRLAYTLTDAAGRSEEGAQIFAVIGKNTGDETFRFNALELTPQKPEHRPGETAQLLVSSSRAQAVVLVFPRPDRGVYPAPELLRLEGNQAVFPLPVKRTDMPNFFVEALTIFEGRIYTQIREIIVPPENRTLSVDIKPSAGQYKPGEQAKIELAVRDEGGRPFTGPLAVSVYDKAVEYISGGSNVPEIRSFFWKWRRSHHLAMTSSLRQASHPLYRSAKEAMQPLGALGRDAADNELALNAADGAGGARTRALVKAQPSKGLHAMEEMAPLPQEEAKKEKADAAAPPPDAAVEPVVRKEFADTAFWSPALETDKDGKAQVLFKMPDNLTEWKVRTWALGSGASVGENQTALTTSKNLLVRLQAPRFFVENDEVTISGNIHNYLAARKTVQAKLELGSTEFALPVFTMLSAASQDTGIDAGAEARVDWRLRAVKPGQGILRMFALSDEESDAAETSLPVYVHGMLKTESFAGSIRPEGEASSFTFHVPAERRTAETRLEVRYSPSLAAAMVDALPYLANYPYGCTEQTLNRFLPTVVVQKVLRGMKLDLEAVGKLRTNLNAQERGDPAQRKAQWQRYAEEPVFDTRKAQAMAKAGLERLGAMQLADGGWGWFSGTGERSSAHTTALVVRGLQTALEAGVEVDSELLRRGIDWLKHYQETELQKLKNAPAKTGLYKEYADNLDAFVFMVLAHADYLNSEMRERLYSDRAQLSVYAKAMFAVSLLGRGEDDKVSVLSRNIRQFLVEDPENGTAYLKLNEPWWRWYGSEFEAHAYYLKLLSHVESGGTAAPGLVKYLLNNRKHAAHWNSTRDTALVIEALADYLRASGETEPELSLELLLDGRSVKKLQIDRDNLFSFDNLLVLSGAELSTGTHTVELKKSGKGPIYYSANLENFTLEDFINRAGLEIKLDRRCYKLVPAAERSVVSSRTGQAVQQRVEKYNRVLLDNHSMLKSGELVEVELEIDSKNDYEYLVFEDFKAAGFEPVEVRSGYTGNELNAYVEFRDERVVFFVRTLARGKHSVTYRMRAEIPGVFSALPARASAMYAPELKANSDEIKLGIED